MAGGHVAVALKPGLASIATYTDGTSNIAAWQNGVPSAGKTVYSVLQNQHLLVDRGVAAANVTTCVLNCWGGTIQNLTVIARSGLGITATGQLVWAAGEQLSPAALAGALVGPGRCVRSSSTSTPPGLPATSTCTIQADRQPHRSFPGSAASPASYSHRTAAISSPSSRTRGSRRTLRPACGRR